ncbi:MAG: ABC transporter ATP-binding protein, partial [Candidatus Acidiferrum sp.]
MAVGVRTRDLRKVYSSAPPSGVAGAFIARGDAKSGKQPKTQIPALDGLSLDILPGEIFGLLGPNGAGKSTTVGVLTTRVRPTSGEAWIGEHDVWKEQARVKHLIGVVPQRPNLDFSLTAREILIFHGAYFGIGSKQRNERADALLEKFKLTERANQMVRGFSGGMMQRLSIARAMMHDPQVLFLDEPSAGLDPQTRILLWETIREYHQAGRTVLLTTHNMEEADALCQRLAIIGHTGTVKGIDPRRIPGAASFRQSDRGFASAFTVAGGSPRGAGRGRHGRRRLRGSRRFSYSRDREPGREFRGRIVRRSHFRTEFGKPVSAPYRKEPARLNWKTFGAMLARDAHVARRNAIQLFLQTFLQPLLFVFIFGRVMVGSGYMPAAYK